MLTVSLVSHGQGRLAQRVLDDLSLMDGRLAHVIVTRNRTEAWTPRLDHPSARLTVVDNSLARGFGANHNAAFRLSTTEFFAVLNPDLDFNGTNLPDLLGIFGDDRIAAASPTITDARGRIADFERDLMTLPNLLRRLVGLARIPGEPAWIAGMCLVFRSSAFLGVGGFDERYFLYCEDADICGRLVLRGWALGVDPALRVIHEEHRLSLRSPFHFMHHIRSLLTYWCTKSFWRHRAMLAAAGRT